MDPVTASLALTAVTTAAGSFATYQSAQSQKAAATYQGQVAQQNQALAERQAQDIEARGAEEEDAYRKKLAQLRGSQITQMAGTGADVSSGSFLDIFADTGALGQEDILKLRQNTQRAAYGQRLEGRGYGNQASLFQAQAAGISPGLNASASFLGGAAQFSERWYTYKGNKW